MADQPRPSPQQPDPGADENSDAHRAAPGQHVGAADSLDGIGGQCCQHHGLGLIWRGCVLHRVSGYGRRNQGVTYGRRTVSQQGSALQPVGKDQSSQQYANGGPRRQGRPAQDAALITRFGVRRRHKRTAESRSSISPRMAMTTIVPDFETVASRPDEERTTNPLEIRRPSPGCPGCRRTSPGALRDNSRPSCDPDQLT